MKVYNFIQNNNDKIILATGDIDQLESIEIVSNGKDYEKYINHCIIYIFPNEIFLKENKRLKNDDDKLKLKHIKYDVLKTDLPITEIIKKD